MKHGIKLRKLQRTSSHRYALLRNLVSALLHHEAIKTTVPKAKEAARMAEKMITLGKKGTDPARRAALAFLMPSHYTHPSAVDNHDILPPKPLDYPQLPNWLSSSSSSASSSSSSTSNHPSNLNEIPTDPETFITPPSLPSKLFQTLSTRYSTRPGGYTRIQKYGRRPGDNAPVCILSLVDGPRDLKFEMVARAVGKETSQLGLRGATLDGADEGKEGLRERTRRGLEKVLKYRGEEGKKVFYEKAGEFADTLLAEEQALKGHWRPHPDRTPELPAKAIRGITVPYQGRRHLAGERMSGMSITQTGLGLARGALGRKAGGKEAMRMPKFMSEGKGGEVRA